MRLGEVQRTAFAYASEVAPDAITDVDARLASRLREAIAACVECAIASIERVEQWSGRLPPVVVVHMRSAARSGVSLTTELTRCLAWHAVVLRFVLEELARCDLSPERRLELSLQAQVAMGWVLRNVQAEIADVHLCEVRQAAHSRVRSRAEIARRILAGERLDAAELVELDYELDGWHLGVIATGMPAGSVVRGLAARLGCGLLPVAYGRGAVWASLGARRRLEPEDVERLFTARQDGSNVSLAVGEPMQGREGWCVTHRQARAALEVARCRSLRFTRYRDVALEAAALQDEVLGDALIARCLEPLDDGRGGGARRRRVLRALFAAEHNKSSARHALGSDRDTVYRHVKEIERRLGCPLHERQAEIEVALRVEELRQQREAEGRRPHGVSGQRTALGPRSSAPRTAILRTSS